MKNKEKTVVDQGINQIEALKALKSEENQELESIEGLFPKNMRTDGIEIQIDEIRKWGKKIERKDLKYKTNNIYIIFKNLKQ